NHLIKKVEAIENLSTESLSVNHLIKKAEAIENLSTESLSVNHLIKRVEVIENLSTENLSVNHLIKRVEVIENLSTENLSVNLSRRKGILKTEDPSQLPNTKNNAKRTISSILRIENLDLLTSLQIKKQKMTA